MQHLFSIRSRLENTGEDWSSLLVSLRDLNEWVSSQETELLAMGPVGGDEILIRKQQVTISSRALKSKCVSNNLINDLLG